MGLLKSSSIMSVTPESCGTLQKKKKKNQCRMWEFFVNDLNK